MPVRISKPGKYSLSLDTPVMNAAGIMGFGDHYRTLVDFEQFGAFVTNPITYSPWTPAIGTRVIPLASGALVHTGLPNPGSSKLLTLYRALWARLPIPVIAHVVAHVPDEMAMCIAMLDREESIAAMEIGLGDDLSPAEVEWYTHAARRRTDKPLLMRLHHGAGYEHGRAAIDAGADALVTFAPPRGTARDPNGRLMAGRLYGPMIKPITLRLVGQMARKLPGVTLIAAGGIHDEGDARDYLEAGATAVQVDAAIWSDPGVIARVGRDLGGLLLTRPSAIDEDLLEQFLKGSP